MKLRTTLFLAFALTFGVVTGCTSSQEDACGRLADCGDVPGGSVATCTARADDALSDGRLFGDEVDRCLDCLYNNTCEEIRRDDCDRACDDFEDAVD